ncbi:hypothetical protein EWM64_g7367, partial [Hericium alpestre]
MNDKLQHYPTAHECQIALDIPPRSHAVRNLHVGVGVLARGPELPAAELALLERAAAVR